MDPSNLVATSSAWTPYISSVLRIEAVSLFMLTGTAILFAFQVPAGIPPTGGTEPSPDRHAN